jgi:methyl-accepting chemotaxis protein
MGVRFMSSSWSLRGRLLTAFGTFVFFLFVMGIVNYYALHNTVILYGHVTGTNLPNSERLAQIQFAEKDIVVSIESLINNTSRGTLTETALSNYEQAVNDFNSAAKMYEHSSFVSGEDELWNQVKKAWTPLIESSERLITLAKSGRREDIATMERLFNGEYAAQQKTFHQSIQKAMAFQYSEAESWSERAEQTAKRNELWSLASLFFATIVAFFLGFMITRAFTLTLRNVAQQLYAGAGEVADAAHQISTSSEELSAGATEQAASLQETSSSIEEMSAMIAKTADNAKSSSDLSQSTHEIVGNGQYAVSQVVEAIREIDRSNMEISIQIAEGNREIAEIEKVISEIGNKTKVINDIVFQTKLLSFNASVEAARAGEHGKGFAVVAEEVGNLAQMSGNAAKEISEMLSGSIAKVESIVEGTQSRVNILVESSKQKVEAGTQVAANCETAFLEIVKKVEEVRQRVGEISTATQEQAHGAAEISRVITQLDQVTKQNTTVSQQTSSAAHELSSQAEVLASVVSQLVIAVEGEKKSLQFMNSHKHVSPQMKKRPRNLFATDNSGKKTNSDPDRDESGNNMAA